MVSTTFADSPALNVPHSKDLVNWIDPGAARSPLVAAAKHNRNFT